MKSLTIILGAFFILSVTPASMGKPNQMAGIDWGTKGYKQAARDKMKRGPSTCSSYTAICIRRGNEASICQSAGAQCMQTGIFVGPKGGRFTVTGRR